MDYKTATVEQLKAAAYDALVAIENAQKHLREVNAELVVRAQPVESPKE